MKRFTAMLLIVTLLFSSTFSYAEGGLMLPAGLVEISSGAFSGTSSLTMVDVPHGTQSIASHAFQNSSVEKIYIPGTVTSIADDAFAGTGVVISSPAFSYAQEWAESHDFQWEDSGNHYRKDSFDSAVDLIQECFMLENEEISSEEMLSTEGITDPEELELIAEHNKLVVEMQQLIADCSNASALETAMDSLGEFYTDVELFKNQKNVVFSYGGGQIVIDTSLYDHMETGAPITESMLSSDGTRLALSAGGTEYMLRSSGSTIYLSAKDVSEPAAATFSSARRTSFNTLEFFKSSLQTISTAYSAINIWLVDQVNGVRRTIELNNKFIQNYEKLGLEDLRQHASLRKYLLEGNLKALTRLSGALAALAISGQITSGFALADRWHTVNEIYDHGHPTKNDLSAESLEVSEQLNREIQALWILFATDSANTIASLSASLATIVNAIGTYAAPPPQVKAICAFLTGGAAVTLAVSFALGLGISGVESRKYANVLALDASLHTTVYGVVSDLSTKKPIPYVTINCGESSAWTDENGAYEIYLPAGTNTLFLSRNGYQRTQVTVTAEKGKRIEQNIEMQASQATVSGIIRDAQTGETPSNVTVLCLDQMELSAYDGSYSITLPTGVKTISFLKDDYAEYMVTLLLDAGQSLTYNVSLTRTTPTSTPAPTATPTPTPQTTPPADFRYLHLENEVLIDRYEGTAEEVTIPSVVFGKPVTGIDSFAFEDCDTLRRVTIPSSVTLIKDSAFAYCDNLEYVDIPNSVTTIEQKAFMWCEKLVSLSLPSNLKTIGDSAFWCCTSFTNLTIPEGVTSIGSSLFYYCENLTSVTIPSSVQTMGFWPFDGCYKLATVYAGNSYIASLLRDYDQEEYPLLQIILK